MCIKTFWLILIALCLSFSNSFAQNSAADTLLYSNPAKQVIEYFNTTLAEQAPLYNGAKYEPFSPFATKGSVYFMNKSLPVPGSVCYNGSWYHDVPVVYDNYNDDMVANLNGNLFILKKGNTSGVFLSGRHFIYMATQNPDNLKEGYYDLAYDGKTRVMVKRVKLTIENVIASQTVEVNYVEEPEIYVKKNNTYVLVKGKGTLLDLLSDKKKDLKKYIKANKLNFTDEADVATARLAGYYDAINK